MREWIEAQLAAGLPALAGTTLHGTIAVTPELINQFIAEWLAAPTAAAPDGDRAGMDWTRLRPAIKSAAVRSEGGRLLVDFDVRI